MQVAVRTAVPVGLVRWRNPASSYSVVVKLTYDANDGRSPAPLSRNQLGLSAGEKDSRGLILEQTDFVASKSVCDVVLAGSTLSSARPVRARVNMLDATVAPALTTLGRDCSCAPPEQRIPIPTLPLTVMLDHAGRTSVAQIAPPAPAVSILVRGASRAVPILMRADTVLIHPWHAAVTVVYRGTFQHAGNVDREVTLMVDISGRRSENPHRDIQRWLNEKAIEPGDLDPDLEDEPPPLQEELSVSAAWEVVAPPHVPGSGGDPPRLQTLVMKAVPAEAMEAPSPTHLPPKFEQAASAAGELAPQQTMSMEAFDEEDLVPQPTMNMAIPPNSPHFTAAYQPPAQEPYQPASYHVPTFGPPPSRVAPQPPAPQSQPPAQAWRTTQTASAHPPLEQDVTAELYRQVAITRPTQQPPAGQSPLPFPLPGLAQMALSAPPSTQTMPLPGQAPPSAHVATPSQRAQALPFMAQPAPSTSGLPFFHPASSPPPANVPQEVDGFSTTAEAPNPQAPPRRG